MTTESTNAQIQPEAPNTTERTARRNLLSARSDLMHNLPFFATLSLNMNTTIDYGVRSIATDGVSLKYNPAWIAAANPKQIKSALAACVVSCSLHHHIRRGNRSYGRWQKACNMVVTPILIQQGLLNQGESLKLSAERAYDQLEEEARATSTAMVPDQEQQCASQQPSQSGAPGAAGRRRNQPGNGSPNQDNSPNEGQGQGNEPKADDTQQEWEDNDPSGSLGEVQDHPGQSEDEIKKSGQRWTEILTSWIQHAKQQGFDPGGLVQHITAMVQPTIDWRSALRTLLTDFIRTQSTWSRPNRRLAATGPYLPGIEPYGAPPIAFAVDTSGSMSTKELDEVWIEIRECAEVMMPENVRIIQCDATITDDRTYDPEDLPITLEARGRGGTMFTPVFDLLEHDWGEVPIGCLVYLSDLYCSDYPSVPPEYPVIWVGSSNASSHDPPFGIRIDIEN